MKQKVRIQYYPIPTGVFVSCFFLFMLVSLQLFGEVLFKELRSMNHPFDKLRTGESRREFVLEPPLLSFWQKLMLPESLPKEVSFNDVIFHGDRSKKEIALTFDADMTPGMKALLDTGEVGSYYNKAVIDVLNATQTKATLFLTGMWIEAYPEATKEFASNPLFELASHSYSHPGFDGACYGLTPVSDDQDQEEIKKTQKLLQSVAGVHNTLFRFPGGCYGQNDIAAVSEDGLQVIQWDVVGQDGFNEDTGAIEKNVLNSVQNGSIIVLHMHGGTNAPMTAKALPKIIATLKERGYHFVTLSELLALAKPEKEEFLRIGI